MNLVATRRTSEEWFRIWDKLKDINDLVNATFQVKSSSKILKEI